VNLFVIVSFLVLVLFLGFVIDEAEAKNIILSPTLSATSYDIDSDTNIILSWNTPCNTCHNIGKVTGYTIKYKIHNENLWNEIITGTETTKIVSNLSLDTKYNFKIKVNYNQVSEYSPTISKNTTTKHVPNLINNIRNIPTFKSMIVYWSEPFDGNTPITHYIIQYKLTNAESWIQINSTNLSLIVRNLSPNENYSFKIETINKKGTSGYSNIYDLKTKFETVTSSLPMKSDISNGGGCDNCIPPTLGVNNKGINMVDGGFTFNNMTKNVNYFFTPYDLITINVGEENLAEFKIYDDGGVNNIEHFEFAYGMSKDQYISESNVRIEYDIDHVGELFNTGTWTGNLTSNGGTFLVKPTLTGGDVTLYNTDGLFLGNVTLAKGDIIVNNDDAFTGSITLDNSDYSLIGNVTFTDSEIWSGNVTWSGDGVLKIIDDDNTLDDDTIRIVTSTVSCKDDSFYDCLLLQIYHTFLTPLEFNIVGTNVWDSNRNTVQNYYNHGIHVAGDSLNPPKEISVVSKLVCNTHQANFEKDNYISMLEFDTIKKLWIDKYGYVWQGDEDKIKQISCDETFLHVISDPPTEIMVRTHSEFLLRIMEQKIIAQNISDYLYPDIKNNQNDLIEDREDRKIELNKTLKILNLEYKKIQIQYDAEIYLVENNIIIIYSDEEEYFYKMNELEEKYSLLLSDVKKEIELIQQQIK